MRAAPSALSSQLPPSHSPYSPLVPAALSSANAALLVTSLCARPRTDVRRHSSHLLSRLPEPRNPTMRRRVELKGETIPTAPPTLNEARDDRRSEAVAPQRAPQHDPRPAQEGVSHKARYCQLLRRAPSLSQFGASMLQLVGFAGKLQSPAHGGAQRLRHSAAGRTIPLVHILPGRSSQRPPRSRAQGLRLGSSQAKGPVPCSNDGGLEVLLDLCLHVFDDGNGVLRPRHTTSSQPA
jgi:hypothetical protein